MNILLTSVGRRGYLVQYFKDALKESGKVYVSNSDEHSPAFKYADEYIVSPLIYDDGYIEFLLDYCRQNKIEMLISLFDIDLYVLAQNKKKFEEIGVIVVVSDVEFIKVCNDKWLTYKYLSERRLPTPKTYLELKNAITDINEKNITFPLIVKPRWGMGSLEIYVADNEEELKVFYKKVKRNIENSYLKYESKQDITNSVIIQEKINGSEYGVDIINDLSGRYRSTVIRKKIGMRAGETDAAKILENDEILSLAKELTIYTKHIGNLDIDILNNGEKYYILEMNARFGGGYPFSHLAGVNLPLALIEWRNGKEIAETVLKAETGTVGQKDIQIIKIN
ncbi:carbamoyl-phosphate synthase large chain [Thomasclavelia cocleata]|uniref:Carbamoyl-phosphate synthase large chain n=1 Tax=Thomasclavelia cocleata TaxID=69824 RepID=A0A829ZAE4_9FIRM|nr:ATP-grasp domain-containing protein [Thomasclavelia cocleata]GFI41510.1 carbamoyl-phosphate synthase large chain [Thomasclavelia cocleata]